MDRLQAMTVFTRVAELGSFVRAADALGLSRPMVSAYVADLERSLGVRLFNRTTRRVALTGEGTEYLERCRRILAEITAAESHLRDSKLKPQGKLRVDVPTSFGRYLLMPELPGFLARYPDIELDVRFNDRLVDLIAERVDVTLRVGPVTDPNLVARRVVPTKVMLVASPAYLDQHGRPVVPEDLHHHRLIGHVRDGAVRPPDWEFINGRQRRRITPKFALTFNSPEAPVMAAIRGAGIAGTIDLMVAHLFARRKLEPLLVDWSPPGTPVSIVHARAAHQVAKVRVFADFAADLMRRWRERQMAPIDTPMPDDDDEM